MKEIEGKILNIDAGVMKRRLLDMGATHQGDFFQKRYVFDVVPPRSGVWLRLRTDGNQTTLAIKVRNNDEVDGTEEFEIAVDNFEKTLKLLKTAGIKPKNYQENKRSTFKLGNVTISIDQWPMLNPYLEIEAPTKQRLTYMVKELGYKTEELTGLNTIKIYKKMGINLNEIKQLRFNV
jgi:adenylate cyclase class 2